MKKIIFIIAVFTSARAMGQYNITPTDALRISGRIRKEVKFTLSAFDTLKQTTIGDLKMSDRNGAVRATDTNVKGILLKDLFQNIEFESDNPKSLNRFYLVFSATDGFKLVLSWNEIFHEKSCVNFYLITEKNGKKINELNDRIMIVEVGNSNTGHKRIEGLDSIVIQQAN